MKKKGFIRTTLVTLALAGAITGTAFAAEVPLESLPCNATCESHILVQNLIEGTLTDVPIHKNRGKTIKQCLHNSVNYIKNPDKTDDGEYVSAYMCDPKTAEAEFALSKREYLQITGRRQASDVIAYHFRQSFKPGEITPEEANAIGYEFAKRFTKDNHAFIVCTHIDKAHIHNHIIWNSTTLDCTRKFRNFWGSTKQQISLSISETRYWFPLVTAEIKEKSK